MNIEQEGPQPQLVIQPDRAAVRRYNVRIEDVTKLINTALGGEPVGTLYEGERRFDIVAKFDRAGRSTRRRRSAGCRSTPPTACRCRSARWRTIEVRRRADAHRPRERPAAASRSAATSSAATRAASSRKRRSGSTRRSTTCPTGYQRRLAGHVREPGARPQALPDRDPDHGRADLRPAAGDVRLAAGGAAAAAVGAVRLRRRRRWPCTCAA